MKTEKGFLNLLFLSLMMVGICLPKAATAESHVPAAIDTVMGLDGSVWEQVNLPGFGNENNLSVIAMTEH